MDPLDLFAISWPALYHRPGQPGAEVHQREDRRGGGQQTRELRLPRRQRLGSQGRSGAGSGGMGAGMGWRRMAIHGQIYGIIYIWWLYLIIYIYRYIPNFIFVEIHWNVSLVVILWFWLEFRKNTFCRKPFFWVVHVPTSADFNGMGQVIGYRSAKFITLSVSTPVVEIIFAVIQNVTSYKSQTWLPSGKLT